MLILTINFLCFDIMKMMFSTNFYAYHDNNNKNKQLLRDTSSLQHCWHRGTSEDVEAHLPSHPWVFPTGFGPRVWGLRFGPQA